MKLSIDKVTAAVGGAVIHDIDIPIVISGVSIDSREDQTGKLFVALTGERADGHDFVQAAFAAGASAALVERDIEPETLSVPSGAIIKVESTRQALKDLAAHYIRTLSVKVVGITGSAGKTTTKDMIASVLSQKYHTLKTEGNFNNEIGLPLTVFRLEPHHEYAVIEMGMNHAGEIDRLSKLAPPDIAVITNIGLAHVENLGSREGIFAAKSEIFNHMKDGAVAVLNGDDDKLQTLRGKLERICYFGTDPDCFVRASDISLDGISSTGCMVKIGDTPSFRLSIPLPGRHIALNALAAAAVGHIAGVSPQDIQRGIGGFTPTKMRMDISGCSYGGGEITVINDCYNASPDSMKAALDILANAGGRKVCILGDMMELGDYARQIHIDIAKHACSKDIDMVVLVGERFGWGYEAIKSDCVARYFVDQQASLRYIDEIVRPGDTVLVKAARGMKFEQTVKHLRGGE
ncbi:MAG: UDP-N-acetylmuramoyl-tripeptide--D-alanyl-D-alanine ligase [Defluviitaleaceae bacterium]|nr:UDP-N-acetylmuramoyl-tripeptide--D-alanyl-D-alanine ligase [Defluviitaleaceae bacterium]